jgi:hypothetical protein
MLTESNNASRYVEWLDCISDDGVKDAFRYIVGLAATLKDFDCHPEFHGVIRDFRFIDRTTREQPFALIPNKKWLLFYVRPPAVKSGKYSFDDLRAIFADAQEKQHEHWTVRLHSIDEVILLTAFLRLS